MGATAEAIARPTQQAALDPARSSDEARTLQRVARAGLSGAARAYPHGERIRAAFGAHAPEGLRAHIGGAARMASERLSAGGYVFNGRVAFPRMPDLHTAAHEAAHLVHQARGGVDVAHGVGVHSDPSEAFADRVADAVVAGRSAEGLFASAPASGGPGGGPLLQMNTLARNKTKIPTPWAQMAAGLPLKPGFNLADHIRSIAPGFDLMITTLGDSAVRATTAKADITGKAPGSAERKGDPVQGSYGRLGGFEEFITSSVRLPKYDFNGGHLISYAILGDASNVQGNLAPQRRYLNSPIFRKIEEIAEGGITGASGPKSHTMTTTVSYSGTDTFTMPMTSLIAKLSIPPAELTIDPLTLASTNPSITLTSWVPNLWQTTVEAPVGYKFAHNTSLAAKDSAMAGFLPEESSVSGEDRVLANRGQTATHLDANFWAMNSMKPAMLKGMQTTSSQKHTFTATQSPPRAGLKMLNSKTATLPAPTAMDIPVFDTDISYDDLALTNTSQLPTLAGIFLENGGGELEQLGLTKAVITNSMRMLQGYIYKEAPFTSRRLSKKEKRAYRVKRKKPWRKDEIITIKVPKLEAFKFLAKFSITTKKGTKIQGVQAISNLIVANRLKPGVLMDTSN